MDLSWRELARSGGEWLIPHRLSPPEKKTVAQMRARLPRPHKVFWLMSSGTSQLRRIKAIALSQESILLAAESANRHLQSSRKDRWLQAIPSYHIGGLSIYARAHLSGAKVLPFSKSWQPHGFSAALVSERITLTSLVPTQIHDLVRAGLQSPPSLRAVVVGGASLAPALYYRARALGWPLLPSYGLTECSSQVATAPLVSLKHAEFPSLQVLPHVEIELRAQVIHLRSQALCRWLAFGDPGGMVTLEDPLRDGWLRSEDLAELGNGHLKILGRKDDVVKILGLMVPVLEVEHAVCDFLKDDSACVLALPDARAGQQLVLVSERPGSLREWNRQIELFNASSPGLRRLAKWCWTKSIPRNDLGKVAKARLIQQLFS